MSILDLSDMNTLTNLLILINFSAVVQAAILIAQLIRSKYLNIVSNRLLALVLLAFSILIMNSIRAMFDEFLLDDYELYSNSFILVIGPSIYLYIIHLGTKDKSFRLSQLSHFVPFAVYFLAILIFHLSGSNTDLVENVGFLLFLVQNITYLSLSFLLLEKHNTEIKNHFSNLTTVSLDWVRNILLSYTLTFVLATAFIFYQIVIGPIPDVINLNIVLIYSLHIIFLSYKSLSKPDILFKVKPYQEKKVDSSKVSEIYERVEELVKEEKLYLNKGLTLKDISDRLEISGSYLSQAINRSSQGNFFDFVNRFRVDDVKQKIADPSYQHLTLLALAELGGFQSGSVFNSAFKKNTGMKPSEYRRSVMNSK